MLRRQGMSFIKCPGFGSTTKWSPCPGQKQLPCYKEVNNYISLHCNYLEKFLHINNGIFCA